MGKYKVGVIGLGWNGLLFCDKYKENPDCELVAICDHHEERREPAAAKYGVKVYTDDEMMADSDIDIISVHTPDHKHAAPFIKALEAGKHVFCEKPLANNTEDIVDMVRASRAHPDQVQLVGFILRFGKYFEAVKEWIDNGTLGDICYIESDYIHDLRFQRFLEKWKLTEEVPMLGGGAHALDLIRWLAKDACGDIEEVTAMSHHISYEEMAADTSIATIYRFGSGAIGKVATLYGSPTPRPFGFNLSVYGTKGSVVREKLCLDGMGEESMHIPDILYDPTFDFAPEISHFVDCIKKGITKTRITPEDAAMSVLGAIAGTQAAAEKRTVAVPSLEDLL